MGLLRPQYVWRVVIDHKPDAPKDWAKWVEFLGGWFKYADPVGPIDPDDPYPYELDDAAARDEWKWWQAGRRLRYLSQGPAAVHIKRLSEHGVDAHLERGTVTWERWPR